MTVFVLALVMVRAQAARTQTLSLKSLQSKIRVAASFYPMYFLASLIGGEKAEVFNITPVGAEPHDYEPTPEDIEHIAQSRLIVLNGIVEEWGDKITQLIDPKQTIIIIAGRGLEISSDDENENALDPHEWLSPKLAQVMAWRIEYAYAKIDPADAKYFAANTKALVAQLKALDIEYRKGLKRCALRDVITSHAAFGYLAHDYGLHQVPIAGLSPDAQPSPRQLAQVSDYARKNGIKVIFSERLVSPKLSQTIASEIGAQTMALDPIEGLSAQDIATGKDYFTQMRQNLANLRAALQCR